MTTLRDARWVANNLVAGAPVTIPQPELTELMRRMRRVVLPSGAVLYAAGGPVGGVWIVTAGRVAITKAGDDSRRLVSILRPGDVIGDVYLLLQTTPPFTARCMDATACWFLPADDFRRLIALHPSIAAACACNLAHRLSRSRDRILASMKGTLPQRLARVLLAEGERNVVRISQEMLAQMVGAQRTSVNKVLRQFERDKLVELGYAAVMLRDVAQLAAVAGSDTASARDAMRGDAV